ncbi:hypothetical protein F0251_22115 [Vibrio sp. 070316B]|uniref:hypothetical protein n=1 Tax=Vibrio sp. 070316B TaxID=2607608 RepID=UPI0014937B5C|nr:hypothetical protein [Vibrio sp. 070316B]NOI41107.1 hypothetical protein [Vibrio sp. 070316B]
MAVPFIVLDGDLSSAIRLRKAILMKSASEQTARLVTTDDVKGRWAHLGCTGYCVSEIVRIANAEKIEPETFEVLMRSMNSYL